MPLLPFNSVGGYSTGITATAVIDSLGNITGVGATFSGLIRANAGISASGGTFGPNRLYTSGNISADGAIESGFNSWFRGNQWLDPYGQRVRTVYNWGDGPPYSIDFKVSATGATDETTRFNISATGVSGGTAFFSGLLSASKGISASGITLSGNLSAATKSFVIPHPTKPQMTLQHGSLEGPENGVYVRGHLIDVNTIPIPDYWYGLVDSSSITVNLTEIGMHNPHWVVAINNYNITVASENNNINCFYTVWGERKDVGKMTVEY